MTRRRFYAPPEAFNTLHGEAPRTVRLTPEESRHLRDVLRLRAGDEAFVFDGEGGEFRCVVAEVGGGKLASATLEVGEPVEPLRPESPLRLTLFVALLKGEKFDLVVQKATELGVWRIVPVVTKRADVRPRDTVGEVGKRTTRWQRLALEAAKQSGRARVAGVEAPRAFASVVAGEAEEEQALRLLFSERGGRGLSETLASVRDGEHPASVAALVGPEGGWEDEELSEAREAGWSIVTLGGRTLRAETAAISVAVLLQHLLGDLK